MRCLSTINMSKLALRHLIWMAREITVEPEARQGSGGNVLLIELLITLHGLMIFPHFTKPIDAQRAHNQRDHSCGSKSSSRVLWFNRSRLRSDQGPENTQY